MLLASVCRKDGLPITQLDAPRLTMLVYTCMLWSTLAELALMTHAQAVLNSRSSMVDFCSCIFSERAARLEINSYLASPPCESRSFRHPHLFWIVLQGMMLAWAGSPAAGDLLLKQVLLYIWPDVGCHQAEQEDGREPLHDAQEPEEQHGAQD